MSQSKKLSNLESSNLESSIFKDGTVELLSSRLSAIISEIGFDEFKTILSKLIDSKQINPENYKYIRGMSK